MNEEESKLKDMNKLLLGLTLLTLFINCSKPEDYCEELYKNYYYDFESKAAMVETINACYEY